MKNLQLLELRNTYNPLLFRNSQLFAQNADSIYFIRDNNLYKHNYEEKEAILLCPEDFQGATHLKLLPIENKICVVVENAIHIFDLKGDNEVKKLCFESNIAAISWNPTEETIAIVSERGDVATYSVNYENAEIIPQDSSSVSAEIPETVYVGWGSKDTQFRGSEGKLKLFLPVETEPVDDRKPTISWRGNGEMFVVNYWVDSKRKFVVFETPCQATFRSEECPGLQPPVAWRPEGNMIATVTSVNNTQNVTIFEKNGQTRFRFEVDFDNEIITDLDWSPCAQILTILTRDFNSGDQTLRLFTSSNYKWYEKQTLKFFKDKNPLLHFEWIESTQFTFTLKVITESNIIKYIFRTVVNTHSGICAVIDGKNLQITNFNDSVIPPIMYLQKIRHTYPINFVFFKIMSPNRVGVVDCENNLAIFDIKAGKLEKVINLTSENSSQFPLVSHHFISDENDVFFISQHEIPMLKKCNLDTSEITECVAINPEFSLRHIKKFPQDKIHGMIEIAPQLYMNDTCYSPIGLDVATIRGKNYNCYLLPNCHFYINEKRMSDCVNSFIIFETYLLYTTKTNELFCVRLDESIDENPSAIYRRNIEQGAYIISAICASPRIVLQLPRGNLETISCRLISIDILNRFLNDCDWYKAVRFIRLEKLNVNLLFDLNAHRFLQNIDRFIDAAQWINQLNSICLEFQEGNVLNSIYQNWGKAEEFPKKIEVIFDAIFDFFDRLDYAYYITTILVINLKFFTLRGGLVYLQDLLRRCNDDHSLKQYLIEGVNTLKNYGRVQEDLYAESLLLYDLDLAHFVASRCQLDPRIYEPHLHYLRRLPEVERRFEINKYAKRPKAAILYLMRCESVDPEIVVSFLKENNVNRDAYENCPRTNRHYQIVSRFFAQDLSRRGNHHEAAIVLKRAKLLQEALDEFKLCLKWREVLNLVQELRLKSDEKLRIVNEMALKLTQNHLVRDAAILYEFYAGSYEMAVRVFLENYCFEDAVHLAKKYNREDIIVYEIIPLLMSHKIYLQEKVTDLSKLYDRFKMRLKDVRKIRTEKYSNSEYDDGCDLFSDAGSTTSKSSRSSRSRSSSASSRSRRKEEKKKQNLREGGIYEDIALVRALHCTIDEIYKRGEEIRSCCLILVQETDIEHKEVKKLYDLYKTVDENIKNSIEEIWPRHFCANYTSQNVQEMADLKNYEHLDVEYRTPPRGGTSWTLNLF